MSKVFRSFRDVNLGAGMSVCLGNFDGLHQGHQRILKACLNLASQYQLVPLVFTFEPHPRKFFTKGRQPKLILTLDEKIELLGKAGFDNILIQEFSDKFSKLSAEDFIHEVLEKQLQTKVVVVGRDFRFGFQAKGNLALMKESGKFEVHEQEDVIIDQQRISSSWIRTLIEFGDIKEANEALGYPYFISGRVVKGEARGRRIGFPTLNVLSEKECIPSHGVYLSVVEDLETKALFPSLTNIGIRPSFDLKDLQIESFLIDTEDDFYDRNVRVFILDRLREERKFASSEDLVRQIQSDLEEARLRFQSMQLMHDSGPTMKWSIVSPPPAAQGFQAFDFS